MKKSVILGLFVCCGIIAMMYFAHREYEHYEREIRDLQSRLAQAVEAPDTFFVHDTVPVWRDKVVEVDRTDYKKLLADKELIKSLRLRISELESVSEQVLYVRDTVYLSSLSESDSILSYSDKWSKFVFRKDLGVLDWEVRDSLSTYVSSEYRHHFLWWRWGKKGYLVTIVNHNPRCRVEYEKYIKIK